MLVGLLLECLWGCYWSYGRTVIGVFVGLFWSVNNVVIGLLVRLLLECWWGCY